MSKKISPLILLLLFTCICLYAMKGYAANADLYKVRELENMGEYFQAAEMYEEYIRAEKGLPDPVRLNIVTGLNQAGYYYSLAGNYKTAAEKLQEALDIAGELEQEEIVAVCYRRLGFLYESLESYDKAVKYYEDELNIYRNLRKKNNVSTILCDIGRAYKSMEQYETAIRFFEDALAIDKESGREEGVAEDLENIGSVYETIGKYGKAIEYYEKALSINRKLGREEGISTGLYNIGNIYKSWGQFGITIKYYEESLDIYRSLWKEDSVVFRHRLNKVGDFCRKTGQYENAVKYYNEVLDIYRNLEKSDKVVDILNNIGNVYQSQGRHEMAMRYYEDALDVAGETGREDKTGRCFYNIGNVYGVMKQFEKAIENYEKASGVDRKLAEKAEEELSLKNLDMSYGYYWSKHEKVIYPYEQAQALKIKFERDADISRDLNSIGLAYVSSGEYKRAIDSFADSLSIIDNIRKEATGEVRKSYLENLSYIYQLLLSAYIKDNDSMSAFQTVELFREKLRIERFTDSEKAIKKQDKGIRLREVEEMQKSLDDDTVIVVYANGNTENVVQIAITKSEITGREVSAKSFIQSSIDKYGVWIETLLVNQRSLTEDKSDFTNIINYYGSLLREPPLHDQTGRGTDIYRYRRNLHKKNAGEIGSSLYELLIKPVEEQIKNRKNLIIVPDGMLTFIPFETLINKNGQYLAEKHTISYIQSENTLKLIRERSYDTDREPLLAFGGAVYEDSDDEIENIENRAQLAVLTKRIYSNLENIQKELFTKNLYPDYENIRSIGNAYRVLGVSSWPDIPETLSEVSKIKGVINGAHFFSGKNVTEKGIKELSKNWKLYDYKALHFATHGLVVPEVPELSALVLSQFDKNEGEEDGYLRSEEIAKLEIQADMVNLSAFDAGLGDLYEDEAFTGFIQSFILSGANAVSISLWKAEEESTSLFMITMYDLVYNRGKSYKDAVTEVKLKFINGEFGEEYKAPYFWSPFVYYGD